MRTSSTQPDFEQLGRAVGRALGLGNDAPAVGGAFDAAVERRRRWFAQRGGRGWGFPRITPAPQPRGEPPSVSSPALPTLPTSPAIPASPAPISTRTPNVLPSPTPWAGPLNTSLAEYLRTSPFAPVPYVPAVRVFGASLPRGGVATTPGGLVSTTSTIPTIVPSTMPRSGSGGAIVTVPPVYGELRLLPLPGERGYTPFPLPSVPAYPNVPGRSPLLPLLPIAPPFIGPPATGSVTFGGGFVGGTPVGGVAGDTTPRQPSVRTLAMLALGVLALAMLSS